MPGLNASRGAGDDMALALQVQRARMRNRLISVFIYMKKQVRYFKK
ncbi:hypothetical protein PATSB16_20730 [Pandoraea thiooxydans]|nr:hypothetical protein PATSB16_20730 [Pandoraea thiooxydans]